MKYAVRREPTDHWAILSLLIANLIPLAGVAFFGWSLTELLLLYWLESAVIGGFTVLRMMAARSEGLPPALQTGMKLFLVPFFGVHYGFFWLIHGFFLIILFAGDGAGFAKGAGATLLTPIDYTFMRANVFAVPVAAMLGSHGVAFVTGFLAKEEYLETTPMHFMWHPYGRVVVLHVTIILGAFAVVLVGQSILVLLIFVLLKIATDVAIQRRDAGPKSVPPKWPPSVKQTV